MRKVVKSIARHVQADDQNETFVHHNMQVAYKFEFAIPIQLSNSADSALLPLTRGAKRGEGLMWCFWQATRYASPAEIHWLYNLNRPVPALMRPF